MKWIIKNPAPTDWRQNKWGDYHFGRSLTKYLVRQGEEVETDYYPEWCNNKDADVVLVLRGKYEYEFKNRKNNTIYVMWNISHPSKITLDEYNQYDMVLVASNKYYNELKSELNSIIYPLLQCTDTEEFYFKKEYDKYRNNAIFVGNTREVFREGVIWTINSGVPLQVWGRGWTKWIDKSYIKDQYIENEQLGLLYNKSKFTLNDHWDDMKEYGYINNRIFDCLACGLPIISDYHNELVKLFPNEILYYKTEEDLKNCLREMFVNYPQIKRKSMSAIKAINDNYSFKKRAEQLINIVKDFKFISKK